jgi:hypothetical protein
LARTHPRLANDFFAAARNSPLGGRNWNIVRHRWVAARVGFGPSVTLFDETCGSMVRLVFRRWLRFAAGLLRWRAFTGGVVPRGVVTGCASTGGAYPRSVVACSVVARSVVACGVVACSVVTGGACPRSVVACGVVTGGACPRSVVACGVIACGVIAWITRRTLRTSAHGSTCCARGVVSRRLFFCPLLTTVENLLARCGLLALGLIRRERRSGRTTFALRAPVGRVVAGRAVTRRAITCCSFTRSALGRCVVAGRAFAGRAVTRRAVTRNVVPRCSFTRSALGCCVVASRAFARRAVPRGPFTRDSVSRRLLAPQRLPLRCIRTGLSLELLLS